MLIVKEKIREGITIMLHSLHIPQIYFSLVHKILWTLRTDDDYRTTQNETSG